MTSEQSESDSSDSEDSAGEERFVALFVLHEAAIHSFLLTIVPSFVDAEEILQDSSLTMWRKFDQFQEGTSFRNWSFQIAKFTALNHIRKRQRDRHVFGTQLVELIAKDVQDNSLEIESRRSALRHCIEKLKDGDKVVLKSCYTKNATVALCAESTGRTPNAIYKQLNRIRRELVKCVRGLLGEMRPLRE